MGLLKKHNEMKKIIEFVGPPGSGKTTIAAKFLKELNENGFSIRTNRSLAKEVNFYKDNFLYNYRIILLIFCNIFSCLKIVSLGLRGGLGTKTYNLFRLHVTSLNNISFNENILLYDQEIINFISTSCSRGELDFAFAEKIVNEIVSKQDRIIIRIYILKEIAAERILIRIKNHPLKKMEKKTIEVFNEKYDLYLNKITNYLINQNLSKVIYINGTESVQKNVTYLKNEIKKYL
jgi:DNA polymerase III delta prime subunit